MSAAAAAAGAAAATEEDAGNLGEKRGQLEDFYTHRPFRHIALCVAPAAAVLRVQLCSHLSLYLLDERRLVRRRGSLIAARGKRRRIMISRTGRKKSRLIMLGRFDGYLCFPVLIGC